MARTICTECLSPGSRRPKRVEVAARGSGAASASPSATSKGKPARQGTLLILNLRGIGQDLSQRGRPVEICGAGLAGGPGPAKRARGSRAVRRAALRRAVRRAGLLGPAF